MKIIPRFAFIDNGVAGTYAEVLLFPHGFVVEEYQGVSPFGGRAAAPSERSRQGVSGKASIPDAKPLHDDGRRLPDADGFMAPVSFHATGDSRG